MNVQDTNEIRELTTAELNEVSGGHLLIVGAALGVASVTVGLIIGSELRSPNLWEQAVAYHKSL